MYERSYVVSSDGNVSVRLDDGRILATPTMTCKGRMSEDLIAVTEAMIDARGDLIDPPDLFFRGRQVLHLTRG